MSDDNKLIEKMRFFRLRGNYPNKRTILASIKYRFSNKREASLPGHLSPVVEIKDSNKALLAEIRIRDMDIPFLCQEDPLEARKYLAAIIRARNHDLDSEKLIKQEVATFFRKRETYFKHVPWTCNEFVIPSTCKEKFSEEMISNKGSILLDLSHEGYPVPDFVILSSLVYQTDEDERRIHIANALDCLERLTSLKLGSEDEPLIFAIRCAMPRYMPGVMPTYLNVGATEKTLPALSRYYGADVAHRIYLNNLKNIILGLDPDKRKLVLGHQNRNLYYLSGLFTDIVKKMDPALVEDPYRQASFLINQCYSYYEKNLDLMMTFSRGEKHTPSLILQKMVCTVRHPNSHVGVLYSRHPRDGDGHQIEYAKNLFGEDIMSGCVETEKTDFLHRSKIKEEFPANYHFIPNLAKLERKFQSPVTLEFATDVNEKHSFFALLQLNLSELTGRSAFFSVLDLYNKKAITARRVTELIKPYHLKQMESDAIDDDSLEHLKLFTEGTSILPRTAVSAKIFFSAQEALKHKKAGHKVCFCKKSFEPSDTVVMREMDAIISLASVAIHVVTLCQSYGLPALMNMEREGVELKLNQKIVNAYGLEIKEGDWITISSKRAHLYKGRAKFKPAKLIRYVNGENVRLKRKEKPLFEKLASAYYKYYEIINNLQLSQISGLSEVVKLVNFDLRGEQKKARKFVNNWFDQNETLYVDEVFKCDMGDHLNQHGVFNMLTLNRKIRFFKNAIQKCKRENISGLDAGAFMLGRFLCNRHPVKFWNAFTSEEIAILLNEWILFEKYLQVLRNVGERRVAKAKRQILQDGLEELPLQAKKIKHMITLKLSSCSLDNIESAVPAHCDTQTEKLICLLKSPFTEFYNYDAPWSISELEDICNEENVPFPAPS